MTHPTREQLHQMAQEKSGELVQLVSELIQIPSETPLAPSARWWIL